MTPWLVRTGLLIGDSVLRWLGGGETQRSCRHDFFDESRWGAAFSLVAALFSPSVSPLDPETLGGGLEVLSLLAPDAGAVREGVEGRVCGGKSVELSVGCTGWAGDGRRWLGPLPPVRAWTILLVTAVDETGWLPPVFTGGVGWLPFVVDGMGKFAGGMTCLLALIDETG